MVYFIGVASLIVLVVGLPWLRQIIDDETSGNFVFRLKTTEEQWQEKHGAIPPL